MPKTKKKKSDKHHCSICGNKIKTMCYLGTGICSERHRKLRDGENPDQYESRLPG